MRRGIDVYNGTGAVNWEEVRAAGFEFAMIKASEGTSLRDKSLSRNLTGAAVAGLYTGVYHWIHARTVEEAKKEAYFFLDVIRGAKFEYPAVVDVEDSELKRLGKAKITEIVRAWCSTVRDNGYYAAIYANLDWVRNYLDMDSLREYDLWLAQYYDQITYNGPVAMWQYTDQGRVPGVKNGTGNVDLDISYKDFPAIIRGNGWNNYPKPVSGLELDTREKKLMVGEIYEFLARCAEKPEVKADPWGIVHTEYVRDEGARGYKFRITGLKPGDTQVIATLGSLTAAFPVQVTGIELDTREKDLKVGEIYEFLARCIRKPEVKADPWGIVHTEYVRDEGSRGYKFRITGLRPGETRVIAALDSLSAGFPVRVSE